jgi:SAM-dependent methyltransferase
MPKPTKWNPIFDVKPTSEVPRIRLSKRFSEPYFKNRNLVLEIGCGTGSFTKLINDKGCVGLDIDFDAVKVAMKYCANCQFIVASAMSLPFRANVFDLVCIWGVFEEIQSMGEKYIIVEVQRTLSWNSFMVASAYNDNIVSKLFDPAYLFRGVRHYNLNGFLKLLSESGLTVHEYAIFGGFNTMVANMLFYFYKHVLKKRQGAIKNYFDKKSEKELESNRHGIVYMFISAQKVDRVH